MVMHMAGVAMRLPIKLNKGLYYGDFVASPIAIVVLTTVVLAQRDFEAAGIWGLTLFAGLGAWTSRRVCRTPMGLSWRPILRAIPRCPSREPACTDWRPLVL